MIFRILEYIYDDLANLIRKMSVSGFAGLKDFQDLRI